MLTAASPSRAAVRHYPLDEQIVYTIRISEDEPTTCVFPESIAALEAANLSAKAEDAPPVLLAHAAGTNYFSVRALKPDAKGAANVIVGGRVYALRFAAGGQPDRSVVFSGSEKPVSTEGWRRMLDLARGAERMAALHPELAPAFTITPSDAVSDYPGFRAVVEEVCRFDSPAAVALRVRLENPGPAAVRYAADGLGVRLGREVFPAELADASGSIPAGGSAVAWLVVAGDLPANAAFNVIVPRLP